MSTYLLINLIILIFPLLASFEKRISYYRKWPALAGTIAVVSSIFIFWDSVVTKRGDWMFNPIHVGSSTLFGLPIEELLFFITVPYSCLFVYEAIIYFWPRNTKVKAPKWLFYLLASSLVVTGILFKSQEYTVLALVAAASFLFIAPLIDFNLLTSKAYWLYLGIGFILFIIFNYFLTSLPIVSYNPKAIWNIRLTTIPLEDFFYNFSLLSWYLVVYCKVKKGLSDLVKPKNKEVEDTGKTDPC